MRQARARTLAELFAAYRACRVLLARELVPHAPEITPLPGYLHAMDPDLIRVQRVHAPGPVSFGGSSMMVTAAEFEWQDLVYRVDMAVRHLTPFQQDIVRVQFLHEPELRNDEAMTLLHEGGWNFGQRRFFEQKKYALVSLSKILKVILDTVDQCR